jgi:hypothetical protein
LFPDIQLQQGCLYRDVRGGLLAALPQGAHAMPWLQAHIPQGGDEGGNALAVGRIGGSLEQDQDVQVGAGEELAAAIATHGRDTGIGWQGMDFQQIEQQAIGQAAQGRQQGLRTQVQAVSLDGPGLAGLQARPQGRDILRLHHLHRFHAVAVGALTKAGGAGMPGDTVSTS